MSQFFRPAKYVPFLFDVDMCVIFILNENPSMKFVLLLFDIKNN